LTKESHPGYPLSGHRSRAAIPLQPSPSTGQREANSKSPPSAAARRERTVHHTLIDQAADRATRFAAAEAAETFDLASRPSRTFASEDDLRRALRDIGLSQAGADKAAHAAFAALTQPTDLQRIIAKLDELAGSKQ
jgi:hypothetical protein